MNWINREGSLPTNVGVIHVYHGQYTLLGVLKLGLSVIKLFFLIVGAATVGIGLKSICIGCGCTTYSEFLQIEVLESAQ